VAAIDALELLDQVQFNLFGFTVASAMQIEFG
jgi:hypothetical protein